MTTTSEASAEADSRQAWGHRNCVGQDPAVLYDELTVFLAAPLVWKDSEDVLHPIEALDFEREREILVEAVTDGAGKIGAKINVAFESATTDRLGAFLAAGGGDGRPRGRAIHFSCHGATDYVCFEDGSGGTQFLTPEDLRGIVSVGGTNLLFVFVSACLSRFTGEAFIKAGVPHVVCCRQDDIVMDIATIEFSRNFYRALSCGKTVMESFLLGQQAVKLSPLVPANCGQEEMNKFILLPEDGEHNVSVFFTQSTRRGSLCQSERPLLSGHLPHPPNNFVGRESEMYEVLQSLSWSRLVRITGPLGIGKCSLAAAVCRYMNERSRTFAWKEMLWLPFMHPLKTDELVMSLQIIFDMIQGDEYDTLLNQVEKYDVACSTVIEHFSGKKTLIVIDAKKFSEKSMKKLSKFLGDIFLATRSTKGICITQGHTETSFGSNFVESRITLCPLGFEATSVLFGMISPFVSGGRCQTVRSPREFSRLLVPEGKEDITAHEKGLSKRCAEIFRLMGDGIPFWVRSAATEMEPQEYDKLLEIGKRKELDAEFGTRAEVELKLRSLGEELQKAVRGKDFLVAKEIQETYDECCVVRDSFPDLVELNNKVWSLNVLMKHAICQKDFGKANNLQEDIAQLEKRICDEEEAQRRLNGTTRKIPRFETRVELEAHISTVGKEVETAAQSRDFQRAEDLKQIMLKLGKLRISLPEKADLTMKIRTVKAELSSAVGAQKFSQAENLHDTLQLLEGQLSLEEAAEGKISGLELSADRTETHSMQNICAGEARTSAESMLDIERKTQSSVQCTIESNSLLANDTNASWETDVHHVSVSAVTMAARHRFLPNPFAQFMLKSNAISPLDATKHAMAILPDLERCISVGSLRFSTGLVSDDKSVYNGLAGIACVYLRLGQHPSDTVGDTVSKQKYLETAQTLAMKCRKDGMFRHEGPDAPISFYCGAPGCIAIHCVASGLLKDMKACKSSLRDLFSYADASLSHFEDELLFGRAGYLYALLFVRSQLARAGHHDLARTSQFDKNLRLVAERIVSSGRSCANMYEYKAEGWLLMWRCFRLPHGGAAHGVIGILKMLYHCWGLLSQSSQLAVRQTTKRLLKCCHRSGSPPVCIGSTEDELVHWCHGSPGLPAMLYVAGKVDPFPTLQVAALRAGGDVWRRGVLLKGNGLCHGLAGNAYAFLSLYRMTGNRNWIFRARAFATLMYDSWVQQAIQRQPDPQRFAVGVPDSPCSLMEGKAGVMCFLLDLSQPDTASFPGWDVEV
eukprot:CAMPEP_0197467160 /NCGR_PEP_ID=MMETSP1175-20131217/65425_1 /TAXON_ID=1003142 /ORGANISM="Triceratium dubium, Strain CCMP147" /LENGTH=1257 /DNA_ID=CAMNT_0043003223 /DNA_START=3 /DNA_END=3776 /DNA_ORIENTATION=+